MGLDGSLWGTPISPGIKIPEKQKVRQFPKEEVSERESSPNREHREEDAAWVRPERPRAPQKAHPRETQAGPATPCRNPTPGSEAICSPAIYLPGEAQHLLIKNISIMVNDLIFPL